MSKKKEMSVDPEWSRFIAADSVTDAAPFRLKISPAAAERKRLARRLGVVSVEALEADLSFTRERGGRVIHAEGAITAEVVQNCVVTAEPLHNAVEERFEAWFADPKDAVSLAKARREREVRAGQGEAPVMEESEDPEPIADGWIDAGELATQFLCLAIDPYPHAEGARFEAGDPEKKPAEDVFRNPFAALKDWKSGQGEG